MCRSNLKGAWSNFQSSKSANVFSYVRFYPFAFISIGILIHRLSKNIFICYDSLDEYCFWFFSDFNNDIRNTTRSYLIKYGGKEIRNFIFKVCQKTWHEKQMPSSWKEAIIMPLHKNGDKTNCCNYRGISLLNTAYKVFSKVLLSRLIQYAEECLGEYQCGFRKGKSTVEQLSRRRTIPAIV